MTTVLASPSYITWIMSEFFDTRKTLIAREILSAAIDETPVRDKFTARLLGDIQVSPSKALLFLYRKPDVEPLPGVHLIFESFACLAHYYGLLNIAIDLNLIPWPLPHAIKRNIILFLQNDKFIGFCKSQYPQLLVMQLKNRVENNIPPSEQLCSHQTEAWFHNLLSLHAYLIANRDLKLFLFGMWFKPGEDWGRELHDLGLSFRTREERFLDLPNALPANQWILGYLAFISALRTIADLKKQNPDELCTIVDNFYAPWIKLLRENSVWIEQITHALIEDIGRKYLLLGGSDSKQKHPKQVLTEIHKAAKIDYASLLASFNTNAALDASA